MSKEEKFKDKKSYLSYSLNKSGKLNKWWRNVTIPIDTMISCGYECRVCKEDTRRYFQFKENKPKCSSSCLWFEWFENIRRNTS